MFRNLNKPVTDDKADQNDQSHRLNYGPSPCDILKPYKELPIFLQQGPESFPWELHMSKRGFVDSVDRSEQLSPWPQEKLPTFIILYKLMLSVSQENFPKIT